MTALARRPLSFSHRDLHVPLTPLKIPSLAPRPEHSAADQKLVERVRREFSDMRGLSPTMPQARRLFHLEQDECFEIFAQLLQEGFLDLGADDRYRLRPVRTQADFAK
jgi:hypothetical protein